MPFPGLFPGPFPGLWTAVRAEPAGRLASVGMIRRPVLAPGLRVLDRGRRRLQIGIDPEHAREFRATEELRLVLDHLDRGEVPPVVTRVRRALATLAPVLVDADALTPPGVAPGDAAAAALLDPDGYAERLAERADRTVAVLGDLGPDPRPLLRAAGIGIAVDATHADVVLLLSAGEPDRELLDPLVRDRIEHLLVRAIDGHLVIGPLVSPGRTACVRCLDAHRAADDPLYPALASVHHRARRHDGVAEPIDSALATLAIAWAVRDVVSHLDGEPASTWSATVRCGPGLTGLTQVQWLRHPECSCSWGDLPLPSATMAM